MDRRTFLATAAAGCGTCVTDLGLSLEIANPVDQTMPLWLLESVPLQLNSKLDIASLQRRYDKICKKTTGYRQNDADLLRIKKLVLSAMSVDPFAEATAAMLQCSRSMFFDSYLAKSPTTRDDWKVVLHHFTDADPVKLYQANVGDPNVRFLLESGWIHEPQKVLGPLVALPGGMLGTATVLGLGITIGNEIIPNQKPLGAKDQLELFSNLHHELRKGREQIGLLDNRVRGSVQVAIASLKHAVAIRAGVEEIYRNQIKLALRSESHLVDIKESQDYLAREFTTFRTNFFEETKEIRTDLALLKQETFSHLSTDRKLEWLRAKHLNLSEVRRNELISRYATVKVAEDVTQTLGAAARVIGGLSKIDGIPEDVVKVASVAVQAGQIVSTTVGALARGDLLGAGMGAITGLVGAIFGGGPDAATLRHQEIVKKLNGIRELQIDTLKAVITTQNMIVSLSEHIQRNHGEIVGLLGNVSFKIDSLKGLIDDVLLVRLRDIDGQLIDADTRDYPPLSVQVVRLRNNEIRHQDVETAVVRLLGMLNGGSPSQALMYRNCWKHGEKTAVEVEQFVEKTWPKYVLIVEHIKTGNEKIYEALPLPVDQIDQKPSRWSNTKMLEDSFSHLLDPVTVNQIALMVERLVPLYLLKNGNFSQIDGRRIEFASNLLGATINVLNLAISQQNVLCGLPLTQLAASCLALKQPKQVQDVPLKVKATTLDLVANNGMLRSNLASWIVATNPGVTPFAYDVFRNSKNSKLFSRILPEGLPANIVAKNHEGFKFLLQGKTTPVPSVLSYVDKAVFKSGALELLQRARDRILRLQLDFEFSESLSREDRATLRATLKPGDVI